MKGVELYARVRFAVQIEGVSQREAARRFGDGSQDAGVLGAPRYRRRRPPARPKLDRFTGIIDEILAADVMETALCTQLLNDLVGVSFSLCLARYMIRSDRGGRSLHWRDRYWPRWLLDRLRLLRLRPYRWISRRFGLPRLPSHGKTPR